MYSRTQAILKWPVDDSFHLSSYHNNFQLWHYSENITIQVCQTQHSPFKMQSFILPLFALLATSIVAMPHELNARADCDVILPACNGGSVVGQTDCRCSGQHPTCDLWTCPGGGPNVVSLRNAVLHCGLSILANLMPNPVAQKWCGQLLTDYLNRWSVVRTGQDACGSRQCPSDACQVRSERCRGFKGRVVFAIACRLTIEAPLTKDNQRPVLD